MARTARLAVLTVLVGCGSDSSGDGQSEDTIGETAGPTTAESTGDASSGDGSSSTGIGDPSTGSTEATGAIVGPQLSFAEAPAFDFGFTDLQVGAMVQLTLTNTGTAPATDLFLGDPVPGFSIDFDDCGDSIEPTDSCIVAVTLTPPDFGPVSTTLIIGYGTPAGEASIDLTAVGVGQTGNLISNAGGELGGTPPVGWIQAAGDAWTASDLHVPPHNGINHLHAGESDAPEHELRQAVDIAQWAELIAAGEVLFAYSAWGRSATVDDDSYRIVLEFRDANGPNGLTWDSDWQLDAEWTQHSGSSVPPAAADRVWVRLYCRLDVGLNCDGFFDDLALIAIYDPEP